MYEERDDETPDWEKKDEEIPPALGAKWLREEKEGLKAGVCTQCGYPFTAADLTCRHCGKEVDLPAPFISSILHWFLRTPWGLTTFLIILVAVISMLAF